MLKKLFFTVMLVLASFGLGSQCACLAETSASADKTKKFQVTPNICFSKIGDYSCLGDLYTPTNPPEGLMPAVLVLHAGGWKAGSRCDNNCVEMSSELASRNMVVFDVDYRLVQDGGQYPNDVQDCWRAADYLRKNAAKYHIDVNRMGVFGASSGGHLALLIAYAPETIGLDEIAKQLRMFKVCVAFCPVTDLLKMGQSWVLAYLNDVPVENPALANRSSPVTYVKTAVPTLIIQGEEDDLVPPEQGRELGAKLKEAGIETELIMIPKQDHYFSMHPGPDHDLALAKGLDFMVKHLAAPASGSASSQSAGVPQSGAQPTRPASIAN